jgi:hypothetical protein
LFDVERPALAAREAGIVDGSFRPIEEILLHLEDFETWLPICLRALFADAND